MAISKRLRFEVLRRDNHACRYFCGVAWNVLREVMETAQEMFSADLAEDFEAGR